MRLAVLLGCALWLISNEALALRCGQRLVHIGDHKMDVLEICGDPEWTDRRIGLRGISMGPPGGGLTLDRYEEVVIDEWVYNFGPRQFKQLLTFENGVLKKIDELDYGR
jgi:hypothetical protein